MCCQLWSKHFPLPATPPRSSHHRTAAMPKGPKWPTDEEASQAWVKKHREAWEESRGNPQPRDKAERAVHRTADAWGVQAGIAQERARLEVDDQRDKAASSSSASAGAARPAFSGADLEADEAKMLWKKLTNSAFGLPGEFEPQQHVSFVAGRPVVAIGLRESHMK